jgi:hypothetical protein
LRRSALQQCGPIQAPAGNIVSYYNKKVMSSATEFECHAGAIMAGVALKGDFVKIADG